MDDVDGMRRRTYELLTNPRSNDRFGRLISLLLLLLIAANVLASVLETDVELERQWRSLFYWLEQVSAVVFTVEYLLRLWTCTVDSRFARPVRGRLRMSVTPMALIDLASLLPFYVELLFASSLDLRFLRVLRLLRLFRLLRASRVANAFTMMIRVLKGKRVELAVSMAIVAVAMLLAAGAIYVAEHNQLNTQFTSIPSSMWWSVETMTTIGYGDMIPATPVGKLIASLVAFVGICAVALPVGILSSGFIEEFNRAKPTEPACPHCGKSP